MSGHTPGPWKQDMVLHKPITKAFSARIITDSEGNNIALGSSWMETPDTAEEAEANARLIAAAPDLLEALKECLPCLGWENDSLEELQREHELGNGYAELIIRARAAIAKAKGLTSS